VVSAKRRAVEQGLGAYIKSETTVIDSQLVADKILSHSAGYVTGYKIIGETKTDDGFSVTIDAKVDYKLLSDDATALAILNRSMGHPRFLVAFSKKGEGTKVFRDMDFIDEIYNGIVESLTDKQFRVVDRPSAQKFAQQVAATHGIDVDLNEAAAFGLQYHAEYTLLYSVGGEIKEGAVNTSVKLRIKTQLIDNTRSQVVASKMVEQSANGRSLETALETAARDGGKKVVNPIVDVLEKNWMDAQQNGQLYTVVIEGVDDPDPVRAAHWGVAAGVGRGFLGQDGVVGEGVANAGDDGGLGLAVHVGDEVGHALLGPVLDPNPAELPALHGDCVTGGGQRHLQKSCGIHGSKRRRNGRAAGGGGRGYAPLGVPRGDAVMYRAKGPSSSG